jgi:hypothetical protein
VFCRVEGDNYSFQTATHEALQQYILLPILAGHALAGICYRYDQSFSKNSTYATQTNEMHNFFKVIFNFKFLLAPP